MSEFRVQQAGLEGVQSAVVPLDIVIVLLGLAMVAQHADLFRQAGIVGGDRACFAASPQILSRVEAERCRLAHRTSLHPSIVLARKILGAMRLASIFKDCQMILI